MPINTNVTPQYQAVISLASVDVRCDAAGIESVDTETIQSAIDSLPATGGTVILGTGTFRINAAITINKPVLIVGAGGRAIGDAGSTPKAITTVEMSSGSVNAFEVTASGCIFQDFLLVNTSATTPTASVGLNIATLANMTALKRVTVVGFWNNAVIAGQYYTVTDCHILDYVNYGFQLYAPNVSYADHGDQSIMGTTFTSYFKTYNAASAVRWEGGGGLRFVNNKINGGYQIGNPSGGRQGVGLDIASATGIGGTGVFEITGCSLENCTIANIRITPQTNNGTDIVEKVNIIGNEFLGATGGNCLLLGATTLAGYNQVRGITVIGNAFSGGTSPVSVRYLNGMVFGSNFFSYTAAFTAITLSGYIQGLYLDTSNCGFGTDTGLVVVNDTRRMNADMAGAKIGYMKLENARRLTITASATPYTIGYVTLESDVGAAATLDIEIDAVEVDNVNAHVGVICARYSRMLSCVAGTATVTLTTLGTDITNVTGTAAYTVTFDTATAGKVLFTVSMTTATHKIMGNVRLKANGMIQKFAIG